jgi:hypothetical protein
VAFLKADFHWDWVQAFGAYVGFLHVRVQYVTEFSSIWSFVFCFGKGKIKQKKKNLSTSRSCL